MLRAYNVPLRDVIMAVERSNNNVGAKVVEVNDSEYMVRGIGLINGLNDIEDITVSAQNGTPVYLRNVATIQLGPEFRRGLLDKSGKEAAGGVVVTRYGPARVGIDVAGESDQAADGNVGRRERSWRAGSRREATAYSLPIRGQ